MKLKDRVAIVTGASSGIGQGSAVALAAEGAKVVITGRNADALARTEQQVKKHAGDYLSMTADLLELGQIDNVVSSAMDRFGRVDILVNSAGVFELDDFTEVSEDFFDRTMDTNFKSLFFMTQRVVKEMKKQGRGKIISLSSIGGGTVGFPTGSVYCSSKSAIAALTQTLAVELAPFKINVNCICPGNVLSPMNQHLFEDKEYEDLMLSMTPWGRIGKIDDITPAVVYLACDESNYVTGIKLVVDGGWSSP
jgi:NAD(P)-dependent dehydrogenase (short-subunit alcohol dehydrogenase family)